jgi:Xaa-Pro aminopeptidase
MRKVLLFFCFFNLIVGASLSATALDRQPNADYRARREALAKKASGMVVLFAPLEAADEVYGFRQEDNFFYLSGVTAPAAALLIVSPAEAKADSPARSYAEILFLPPRNLTQEKWTGPKLGPENPDAAKMTGFDRVEHIGKLPDEVTRFISGASPSIYTDMPAQGESASTIALSFVKRTNAMLSYQDVKPMLSSLRTSKDPDEVGLIHKAVDASVAAHFAAFKAVKPSVNEREISALLQYEWGRRGCERAAYAPIVGSGISSTVLHYSEDSAAMKSGDVVVIDAAGEYSMYAADITRTLPVSGHFSARQRAAGGGGGVPVGQIEHLAEWRQFALSGRL